MLKQIRKEKDVISSGELFNEIISAVKESGKWPEPDVIDYALPHDETGLYDYNFNPHFTLVAGANEGYYLELGIRGCYSLTEKYDFASLGTIKTLQTGEAAIRQMAALYGECLIAYEKIMDKNLDSFTRKGFDLHFLDKERNRLNFGYSEIKDLETALKKFREYNEKDPETYCEALIRNNLTREEKIYN